MRSAVVFCGLLAASIVAAPAQASECPGNPGALGTSRTIVVDPAEHPLLGGFQYRESLPLNDKEIVLTFDDGPLPPYSNRVLDILASECVKATFFMVGRMARAYPQVARRVYEEGHTVANHSQNHPFTFNRMTVDAAAREIEDGFESIRAAIGDPAAVAPFFRVPGLLRQDSVEQYLASRGVMTWSVDFMADDWKRRLRAAEVVRRGLQRIEAKGRGILLLHDIQPATAIGLPALLRELKERGYRIVHVVPATAERPKTATAPEQWAARQPPAGRVAHVTTANGSAAEPKLVAPSLKRFGVTDRDAMVMPIGLKPGSDGQPADARDLPLVQPEPWPEGATVPVLPATEVLPPAAGNHRAARAGKKMRTARRTAKKPAPTVPAKVAAAPKPRAVRGFAPPASSRPIGHQIQLPKPTASLTGGPNVTR